MNPATNSGTFDLLETMKWTPDGRFFLLDRHLHRLSSSARFFDFQCDVAGLRLALDRAVAAAVAPQRVRLLVAQDGIPRIETTPIAPLPSPARVALALAPVDPADVFLYHKTTNRTVYEQAKRADFDDVILWNPAGQVTESTVGNVVVDIDGRRVTPPVACGLLAGTFRGQLLDEGLVEEGLISLAQLRAASRVWLVNSVREWWPAEVLYSATAMASTPTSASTATPAATNRSQR